LRSPTIKDVARQAGVSIATVSRAINRPETVGKTVVARVREAIAMLDYVPDRAARSLVSRRFDAIGAIVPTIDNAIFAKGFQSLQSRLNESGYGLLLTSTEYDDKRELLALQSLIEHGVDGIVLVGTAHSPAAMRLLAQRKVPYVNTWTYDRTLAAPCIGFDNRAAMERLAHYLADLGHVRIAMIAGVTRHNDRAAERVAGVRDALRTRGVMVPDDWLIERPYTIADGRQAAAKLLGSAPRPTALICGNDILAFGALFECQDRGLRVPADISVAGFDDVDLASQVSPALTTMRVPALEMGRAAADYLVQRHAGRPAADGIELQAELIVRGSTAPAPARR
jgi:LacI family transcriptional regulator